MRDLEHPHAFDVVERGVDRHVEVVGVLDFDLVELLLELLVLLALLDDVGAGVGFEGHYLL